MPADLGLYNGASRNSAGVAGYLTNNGVNQANQKHEQPKALATEYLVQHQLGLRSGAQNRM